MSLKTKIQDMIDIINFWKLFDTSNFNAIKIDEFKIKDNSTITIPPNLENIDDLFNQKIANKTVKIKSNKKFTSLKSTFYYCNDAILNIDFETGTITDFTNSFAGTTRGHGVKAINTPLNMYGTKEQSIGLNAFKNNQKLIEVRIVEESIPYNVWDLDFSSCTKLSEESLLSIAKGCETPPTDISDDECGYIIFASTTLENMPQYIKDIFAEKRCMLA